MGEPNPRLVKEIDQIGAVFEKQLERTEILCRYFKEMGGLVQEYLREGDDIELSLVYPENNYPVPTERKIAALVVQPWESSVLHITQDSWFGATGWEDRKINLGTAANGALFPGWLMYGEMVARDPNNMDFCSPSHIECLPAYYGRMAINGLNVFPALQA